MFIIHPVRIARIHYPRFVPRVGLRFKELRTLSALRISKGWVRKDPNLGLRTGCMSSRWVRGNLQRGKGKGGKRIDSLKEEAVVRISSKAPNVPLP